MNKPRPPVSKASRILLSTPKAAVASLKTASLPLTGYAAMSAWVKDNGPAVADFQQALARAQSNASLTGQVQALLPSATHMSTQFADLITIGSYPTSTSSNNLERVVRLMTNFNMISLSQAQAVAVKSMIVHS